MKWRMIPSQNNQEKNLFFPPKSAVDYKVLEAGLMYKIARLASTLGVIKFVTITPMNIVTLVRYSSQT
jgi:hypothetical protein